MGKIPKFPKFPKYPSSKDFPDFMFTNPSVRADMEKMVQRTAHKKHRAGQVARATANRAKKGFKFRRG